LKLHDRKACCQFRRGIEEQDIIQKNGL